MKKKMNIRLALRAEGNFWNAYLALPNTMEGAKLIGSIALGSCRDREIKQSFMDLMTKVLNIAIKDVTGQEATSWDVGPAPESKS